MKNTSLKMKILSGMLCTGLVFSSTGLTFAAVKNAGATNNASATKMACKDHAKDKEGAQEHRAQMMLTLKSVIRESVSSNIITKGEGDKVLEYVNAKTMKNRSDIKKDKQGKVGLFTGLVTDGVLTQEKSDALKKSMYVKDTEIKTLEVKKGLNSLVDKKVITIEQSNKVQKNMKEKYSERMEIYKKMKDMSDGERKAYMKKMESTKVSPMKELIDNGTITKEQEVEIQKILPQHNHGPHMGK